MSAAKINWTKAKNDYLSDPTLSYRDIAAKYGVSRTTAEKHAIRESWSTIRQQLGEQATARTEAKIIDELAKVNTRHTDTYKSIQMLALSNLNILIAEIQSKQEEAKLTDTTLDRYDVYSPTQLNFLGSALRSAIEGERITLGLPTTSVSRVEGKFAIANVDISAEQWERITNATESAITLLRERGRSEQEIEAISSGSQRG